MYNDSNTNEYHKGLKIEQVNIANILDILTWNMIIRKHTDYK